ncbi:MAG: hypothetical protein ACPG8W_16850 [Candidatus Promineifilaceae bacterium]
MHYHTQSSPKRSWVAALSLILISLIILIATPTTATEEGKRRLPTTLRGLEQIAPRSANPYLAFLPDGVEPDYEYWNLWMSLKGKERAANLPKVVNTINYSESETAGTSGSNDSIANAEMIANFGTGAGKDGTIRITGNAAPASGTNTSIGASAEPDGSIATAKVTGATSGNFVTATGTIGDGTYGATSGDFDHFKVTLAAGDMLAVDVSTPLPTGALDPHIALWNSTTNQLVAFSEDKSTSNYDSFLVYEAPSAGDYSIAIGGYRNGSRVQTDPTNPASGPGAASTGTYTIQISFNTTDRDYYQFDAVTGDVIGINVAGAANQFALYDPSGNLLIGGQSDGSSAYGTGSPLPGGGNASGAYVVPSSGMYTMRALGLGSSGNYTIDVESHRAAPTDRLEHTTQILFIDFNGATINANAIFGTGSTSATLSPLSTFLPNWGLSAAQESAVINAIMATVKEGLSTDLRHAGINGDFHASGTHGEFDIEIRNSRDHLDPFGQPNVSRIIVGGTQAQLGIGTIGIADSIDVGNFATEETGVVLLDILSDTDSSASNSLNNFSRDASASIIDIIGVGVGNIINHEAGHYLGNWHTDQFNSVSNLMDQGGNLPFTVIGIGPDNIFGTADDIDPDFVTDTYNSSELYIGQEDTKTELSFALSTGMLAITNQIYLSVISR